MTFSRSKRIHVHHLTTNQPFCSGILLIHRGKLVISLSDTGYTPTNQSGPIYRVGGLGGEQEPGETIWECALRDATLKIHTAVELDPSPHTYFHDIDSGAIYPVHCTDPTPPFLLERQSNFYPYTTPRHPGLPTGPYTYYATFLAHMTSPQHLLLPTPHVQALLLLPLNLWPQLLRHPTLETMLSLGADIIESTPLSRTPQLWLPPNDSFHIVVTQLQKHPELLIY